MYFKWVLFTTNFWALNTLSPPAGGASSACMSTCLLHIFPWSSDWTESVMLKGPDWDQCLVGVCHHCPSSPDVDELFLGGWYTAATVSHVRCLSDRMRWEVVWISCDNSPVQRGPEFRLHRVVRLVFLCSRCRSCQPLPRLLAMCKNRKTGSYDAAGVFRACRLSLTEYLRGISSFLWELPSASRAAE